ncbi:MAG: hypothetical protein WDN44_02675 [Sphingomonas sp.]
MGEAGACDASGDGSMGGTRHRLLAPAASAALLLALLVPLLVVRIPPLIDLPGHLGRYAIQAAPPGDILHRYYLFRWGISLNLGVDLLVEGLRHLVGLVRATWIAVVLTQFLSVAGIVLIARAPQPRRRRRAALGADLRPGLCLPLRFLNFTLAVALSLLGFALWMALERRRRLRAALFVPLSAMLLVVHAVGGSVMLALIAGDAPWRLARDESPRKAVRAAARLWPLLGAAAMVILWARFGGGGHGPTRWVLERKLDGLMMAARDQNVVLDIGTVVAALAVLLAGWRGGARLRAPRGGGARAALSRRTRDPFRRQGISTSGSCRAGDGSRSQCLDWSDSPARLRRIVMAGGLGLLAVRLIVTTIGFVAMTPATRASCARWITSRRARACWR